MFFNLKQGNLRHGVLDHRKIKWRTKTKRSRKQGVWSPGTAIRHLRAWTPVWEVDHIRWRPSAKPRAPLCQFWHPSAELLHFDLKFCIFVLYFHAYLFWIAYQRSFTDLRCRQTLASGVFRFSKNFLIPFPYYFSYFLYILILWVSFDFYSFDEFLILELWFSSL